MQKLGKLGMLPLNLPASGAIFTGVFPQLYLPGSWTSLSVHPPPLTSGRPPIPREEEKVLLVVAWGPVVSLGHLGSVSCTRLGSPWGPLQGAMSPYSLRPWPLRPPLPGTQCQLSLSVPPTASRPRDVHARSHLGPFPLCFFITRGPGGAVTWWVWPRDLKGSLWPSQWCGIPGWRHPRSCLQELRGSIPLEPTATLDHPLVTPALQLRGFQNHAQLQ